MRGNEWSHVEEIKPCPEKSRTGGACKVKKDKDLLGRVRSKVLKERVEDSC